MPIFISWENINYLNNLEINIASNDIISNFSADNSISNFKVSKSQHKYNIHSENLTKNGNVNLLFKMNAKTNNIINTEYINTRKK